MKTLIFLVIAVVISGLIWRENQKMSQPNGNTVAQMIQIERKKHFPPREFHGAGEGVPFPISWRHFSDPHFDGTDYLSFDYQTANGVMEAAGFQFISVNKVYDNPAYRESLMAIEIDEKIYEFSEMDFKYDFDSTFQPAFIGQSDHELFFAYFVDSMSGTRTNYAILSITLPLSDGAVRSVKQSEEREWQKLVTYLGDLRMHPAGATRLCRRYYQISEEIFNIDCRKSD